MIPSSNCRAASILAGGLTIAMLCSALPACAQNTRADAKAQSCAPTGTVDIPPGMSLERMKLLDEGRHFKVYTSVEFADERARQQMPQAMARMVDITPEGLSRIFSDVILGSKRFKVYEMGAAVTAEHSDVLITVKVVSADQAPRSYLDGGRRVIDSRVTLSVQMKNMYTGENLLPDALSVEGRTGLVNGDRVIVTSAESLDSEDVRNRLAIDFKNALNRAFVKASDKLEEQLRPLARVVSAEECRVNLFGGTRFGLQPSDELVIFRVKKRQLGETTVLDGAREVALVRCGSVGVDESQCKIIRSVPGYQPQDGDFALATDESLKRARMR